jgi:hypothetical protein
MGGVIGVVGNKFVLAAATLLLPATVNQHRVNSVFDPSYPTSELSARLAAEVHIGGSTRGADRPTRIGLGAEEFDAGAIRVATHPLPTGIDLRLGRDVLADHIFALDMARDTIRLILKSEYRGATRKLTAIPLRPVEGARWGIAARLEGMPCELDLDLALPVALSLPSTLSSLGGNGDVDVNLDGVGLRVSPELIGARPGTEVKAVLGLRAFAGRRIVLDLPHRLLWIDSRARNDL